MASDPLARPVTRQLVATAAALVTLLVATHPADADDYLESRYPREGFAIGLGLGPGFFAGLGGHDELLGAGLASSLRVGTAAGTRTLLILQLDSVAYRAEDVTTKQHTNIHSAVTLGAQRYLRELLWLKVGVGVATLAERQATGTSQTLSKGFAATGSLGYDALHRGPIVLDLEVTLGTGIYRHGAITQLGVMMAANWY